MHSWYLSSVHLSWEKLLEMKDELAKSHILTRKERSWIPHDGEGTHTRAAYDYDMFNLFYVHPEQDMAIFRAAISKYQTAASRILEKAEEVDTLERDFTLEAKIQ
jgi:hypothetical protein